MSEPLYPLLSLNRLRMEIDGEGVTTLVAGAGCPLGCRYCINADVLKKKPKLISAQELYALTKIDDLYFRATCGGLTFGGGESLLHVPFIRQFRQLIGNGWRLYAETSLAVDRQSVIEAAEVIDCFIIDIKSTDPEVYRSYTGRDLLPQVLDNLQELLRRGADLRVRVPLIPGYNTAEDCHRSAEYLRSLGVTEIEQFPYILPRN